MTKALFTEWLQALNNKMTAQGRHILLFVDNCSAHPPLPLSNIKIVFLPKNTTSVLQPCDAGIIQTIKLNYRKSMLRHIIYLMNRDTTASSADLAKQITLFDACMWWSSAWTNVDPQTIVKCFRRTGFYTPVATIPIDPTAQSAENDPTAKSAENDPTANPESADSDLTMNPQAITDDPDITPLLPAGYSLRDYAAIDNDETARVDDESIDSDTPPDTNVDNDHDDLPQPTVSKEAAINCLRDIRIYCIKNNIICDGMTLSSIEKTIVAKPTNQTKQLIMTNFFKQK